jgi:aromatic ring-opening dioxygenase catalytic subunit (LigB family)
VRCGEWDLNLKSEDEAMEHQVIVSVHFFRRKFQVNSAEFLPEKMWGYCNFNREFFKIVFPCNSE